MNPGPRPDTVSPDARVGHWRQVAEAFSRKALEYDAFGTDNPNVTRMRERVYAHLDALLTPGARILELNAGTGADAVRRSGGRPAY